MTDDTQSLQRLIDAAPRGGTLVIPVGRYRVSAPLTVNKPLTIRGEGVDAYYQGLFGDATYGGPNDIDSGTIIESTAADGAIIDHTPTGWATLRVVDLHLKGVGDDSRSLVGLRIGTATMGGFTTVRGLRVSNCKTGIQLTGIQNSTIDDVWVYGCDVGLSLVSSCAANTITGFNASGCGDSAVLEGQKNVFVGGAIQSSLRTGVIVRGEEMSLRDIYFESQFARYAIDVERRGDCTVIDSCHYGGHTAGGEHDGVRIAASACRVFACKYVRNLAIEPTAQGTQVHGNWSGTIDDKGAATVYVGFQNGGAVDSPGAVACKADLPAPQPGPPGPQGPPGPAAPPPRTARGVATILKGQRMARVAHTLGSEPRDEDVGTRSPVKVQLSGSNDRELIFSIDAPAPSAGITFRWSARVCP